MLVIEDNEDAAEGLRVALALGNHEVLVVGDGARALAVARDFRPDVVLCDISLPGMTGYAVARAFRSDEQLATVHLVALTGRVRPADLRDAREAGFDQHLAKPIGLEELEALLASLP